MHVPEHYHKSVGFGGETSPIPANTRISDKAKDVAVEEGAKSFKVSKGVNSGQNAFKIVFGGHRLPCLPVLPAASASVKISTSQAKHELRATIQEARQLGVKFDSEDRYGGMKTNNLARINKSIAEVKGKIELLYSKMKDDFAMFDEELNRPLTAQDQINMKKMGPVQFIRHSESEKADNSPAAKVENPQATKTKSLPDQVKDLKDELDKKGINYKFPPSSPKEYILSKIIESGGTGDSKQMEEALVLGEKLISAKQLKDEENELYNRKDV